VILASELIVEDVPCEEHLDWPQQDEIETDRDYDPLAASIDHILPRSRGGTDDDGNLQIAHLRCNLLKNDGAQPSPQYARAQLSLTLDGTPIPYRVWRREREITRARLGTPARRNRGRLLPPPWMIERGEVAVEPWRLVLRYRVWRMLHKLRRREAAWIARFGPS